VKHLGTFSEAPLPHLRTEIFTGGVAPPRRNIYRGGGVAAPPLGWCVCDVRSSDKNAEQVTHERLIFTTSRHRINRHLHPQHPSTVLARWRQRHRINRRLHPQRIHQPYWPGGANLYSHRMRGCLGHVTPHLDPRVCF